MRDKENRSVRDGDGPTEDVLETSSRLFSKGILPEGSKNSVHSGETISRCTEGHGWESITSGGK